MENFEKRMYFFVPYQLTGIQKGIQCGHAALEYALKYKHDDIFNNFVQYHKTWIVLNGGTTNNSQKYIGTLNNILNVLVENNIKHSTFFEPDLNDSLTSICVIIDERVFNFKPINILTEDDDCYQEWEKNALNFLQTKENLILFKLINGKSLATN